MVGAKLVRRATLRYPGESLMFSYFQIVQAAARPSTSSPQLLTKKKKIPVATPNQSDYVYNSSPVIQCQMWVPVISVFGP